MTTSKNTRASFSSSSGALLAISHARIHAETGKLDLNTSSSNATAYTVADPAYLSSQLKSAEWLHRYALKSQNLTFDQILQQIGFRRVESSHSPIGKTVDAKYAGNLYPEMQTENGDRYALTCRPEKLREFRNRLARMLDLLRKRLTFITSGSRRVFGIIGEPSVCLVCDCKTSDQRVFNQFQLMITSLLKEQVSKIKRFNIIWVASDNEVFQEQPIDTTSITIDQAIEWISKRKCTRNKISISATCEAVLKAFTNSVHSIYLISEGNSSDSAREILRDNIVKTRLSARAPKPIHVVSLFCSNNDTEIFLRSIAQTTEGNYYSYKIKSEITDLRTPTNLTDPTQMKSQGNKVQVTSKPSTLSFEQPIDISLMYKEINQCQNIIDRLDKILGLMRNETESSTQANDTTKSMDAFNMSDKSTKSGHHLQRSLVIQSSALFNHDENDMASVDWLKIYGVDAQKLDFFSVLQSAAFQHCDGLVPGNKPSNGTSTTTSADNLVSPKYCDQFAHVTWPDGTIRHVYVTPEIHRDYERRMRALLGKIKARLLWLKKGSREVFGTILEKNIYILIDTSKSMQNHLNFIQDKLRLLIQDQLVAKDRVNMASFNTIINPWRDCLTKINNSTTQAQLQTWIDGLIAEGSTNTLGALRFALADAGTEAIYLLSDGRPDQNERHVLSQVQYRQITPIHTIAFNCLDQTANQFLFDLAKLTGGRFHAFNYGLENSSSVDTPESEDISYLKQELIYGEKDLQRVVDLRDECMSRAWSKENIQAKYRSPQLTVQSVSFQVQIDNTCDLTSPPITDTTMAERTDRKIYSSIRVHRKRKSKSEIRLSGQTTVINLNPDQWLLPETEEYLQASNRKLTSALTIEDKSQHVVSRRSINAISSPYGEVKVYLKKNSLVAKGLTILDVLQPASVTVKEPHYIQVLDRYVLSKVWDDILPFTYGSYANKFRLVNHYAVDLNKYETNLRDLITEYYQFTAKFIWKCLNDENKQKLGPHIYWVSLRSEDQQRYAQEISKEEHKDQDKLEFFAWRKLTKDEQNKLLKRPAIYHEKTAIVLKKALKDAECESGLHGVALMDVEIHRAIKFLQISTDLRRYQNRSNNDSKQPPAPTPPRPPPSSPNYRIGQRVYCSYDGDGYFYPGTVQKNVQNQWIVLFDMEIEQQITGHVLLPINSSNQLNLFIQDYVLVRQMRETEECWIPGVVLAIPSPFVVPENLYMIQICNPCAKHIYAHREDMIRITFGLFQRSVIYIQSISRKSITNGSVFPPGGDSPPSTSSYDNLEIVRREMFCQFEQKIEYLDQSLQLRFNKLHAALEELIIAIRLLQERPHKNQVKFEYAQTTETPPSSRPPSATHESVRSISPLPSPTPPFSIRIKPNTHVYAVWFEDDGLVYEGIVWDSPYTDRYTVERKDFPGVTSIISRDDIFLHQQLVRLQDMNAQSFALIKYPNDSRHCFCPAVILRHYNHKSKSKVRFYDCCDKDLHDQNVIPINEQQFERYTRFRIEKEQSLITQVVVGLNVERKAFMLGTIKRRDETGHRYSIEWCDKSDGQQEEEHLFGAITRRDKHRVDHYVIARDENDNHYKLAKTVTISSDQTRLRVQFLNLHDNAEDCSGRVVDVPAVTTFVITEDYLNTVKPLLRS